MHYFDDQGDPPRTLDIEFKVSHSRLASLGEALIEASFASNGVSDMAIYPDRKVRMSGLQILYAKGRCEVRSSTPTLLISLTAESGIQSCPIMQPTLEASHRPGFGRQGGENAISISPYLE